MTEWKPKDLTTARAVARRKVARIIEWEGWLETPVFSPKHWVHTTVEALIEEGVEPGALPEAAVASIKESLKTYRETLRREAERKINKAYLDGDLI